MWHPLGVECQNQKARGNPLTIGEYGCLLDPDKHILGYDDEIGCYHLNLRLRNGGSVVLWEGRESKVLKWKRPTRVFASIARRKEAEYRARSSKPGKADQQRG